MGASISDPPCVSKLLFDAMNVFQFVYLLRWIILPGASTRKCTCAMSNSLIALVCCWDSAKVRSPCQWQNGHRFFFGFQFPMIRSIQIRTGGTNHMPCWTNGYGTKTIIMMNWMVPFIHGVWGRLLLETRGWWAMTIQTLSRHALEWLCERPGSSR